LGAKLKMNVLHRINWAVLGTSLLTSVA
jgi:hypothetical protein